MSEPNYIKEEYLAAFSAVFPQAIRRFSVMLACIFCALLVGSHFGARMKAQYGLNGFLLVNTDTERAFAIWSWIDSHLWLGVSYCALTIALTFSIGRKRSAPFLLSWIALFLLLAIGTIYFSAASYLGGKFLVFRF